MVQGIDRLSMYEQKMEGPYECSVADEIDDENQILVVRDVVCPLGLPGFLVPLDPNHHLIVD